MGKIRVKGFDENQEDKDKKLEAKREAKRMAKKAEKKAEAPAEEMAVEAESKQAADAESSGEPKEKKTKKAKFARVRTHGKNYTANLSMVDRKTTYPLKKAVEMLKTFKTSKFDETIELHINLKEKGVNGQVVLPHGTGKVRKIKVVDDALIAEIEAGKIDFDVLVAHPSMMPKLAKVARVLGPRGLMPNPKNGTVTADTDDAVKKLTGGQVSYKTEAQAPIIHLSVGKISFTADQIEENIKSVINSIKATNIVSTTVKSTMSPAVKVKI